MDTVPESRSTSTSVSVAAPPATGSAATVVLLRDGELGVEVLLAERPSDRGSFAGAWVFPGGAVDDGDLHGTPRDGIDAARRAAVREVAEEVGLVLAADELVPFSRWTPPKGAPKQLTTTFFAVRVPDGEFRLAADEVVAVDWLRPADALERHAAGELTLWPPTWVTLHGLAGVDSVDHALTAFASGDMLEYVARRDDARRMVLWQEDDEVSGARGHRHRLLMDRLPWVYQREF
ncbi:NUDIX hydrolase [Agromyces sp. H3Y2-19a]|uniref:NUDIX hydrolase n=1 Tax=Agromyces chromiiresistens TaxID=3030835 RepID=UPI0023B9FD51|nr:NUDIX hydrolase [Agromyces chromiiresistens]MDF0514398.1 NUDIX hydrolase [Agromyces chromiiresistens]